MKFIGYNDTVKFISNNKRLIDGVKITKLEKTGLNPMEGSEFIVNIKLITSNGYKNKLFAMLAENSYMEDFGSNFTEIREGFQDYLNTLTAN